MKKRLINEMINIETTKLGEAKYNIHDVYVGCIAKRTVSKNGSVGITQIIEPELLIFKYAAMEYFKDIENDKYYPLMNVGEIPDGEAYYIPEKWLHKFTSDFQSLLEEREIEDDTKLTLQQLREIVAELQLRQEKIF